jgi:hypothetical protein
MGSPYRLVHAQVISGIFAQGQSAFRHVVVSKTRFARTGGVVRENSSVKNHLRNVRSDACRHHPLRAKCKLSPTASAAASDPSP